MSKESQALLNAFHSIIEQNASELYDSLVKKNMQNPLVRLTERELKVLETISLTPNQMSVLHKGMIAMGEGIVFSLLCIIDGVADVERTIPDLAIVDRETKRTSLNSFGMMNLLGYSKIKPNGFVA